jgi:hypothetical protein
MGRQTDRCRGTFLSSVIASFHYCQINNMTMIWTFGHDDAFDKQVYLGSHNFEISIEVSAETRGMIFWLVLY